MFRSIYAEMKCSPRPIVKWGGGGHDTRCRTSYQVTPICVKGEKRIYRNTEIPSMLIYL